MGVQDILHSGEIQVQQRLGKAHLGQKMARMIQPALSAAAMAMIESQRFFFIATANDRGECDCSFRGSQPGQPAIKVIDPTHLVFPDYSGNNLFNSLGNIQVNPNIGLLFVDFATGSRHRVNGRAEIVESLPSVAALWPDALCFVAVRVTQSFGNCKARVPVLFPKTSGGNHENAL